MGHGSNAELLETFCHSNDIAVTADASSILRNRRGCGRNIEPLKTFCDISDTPTRSCSFKTLLDITGSVYMCAPSSDTDFLTK
jgi:hypothetical protein